MLESEKVIIESPMSFVGSSKRAVLILEDMPAWPSGGDFFDKFKVVVFWFVILVLWTLLVLMWWTAICAWYLVFGILVIPYRLIRRSQRQNKKRELQHRELLEQIEKQK